MKKINEHVIWGTGTMGGIIAAFWARHGLSVTCVDSNQDHVDAIAANGLKIIGPIEEFTQPLDIIHPDQVEGELKKVYLATKSLHTPQAIRQIEPFLASDGYVVSWQNGLNENEMESVVGKERTIGAFLNFSGDILEPGVINFGGWGATVVGELDGILTRRIQELHENMKIFNKDAVLTHNIFGYLWSKIGYGAMLFAEATSMRGITEMFEIEKWHPLLIEIGREIVQVAMAQKIKLLPFNGFEPYSYSTEASYEDGVKSLLALAEHNRPHTKTHSGVWRDLAVNKRKTEVDMIMGAVLPIAREYGIAIPFCTRIIETIHNIESGNDVQGDHHLDQMAEMLENKK
jgi:2-dehydropantoate 2-reductase